MSLSLNSTMVRLKQEILQSTYGDDVKESQFHYGSIKTIIKYARKDEDKLASQFHYGSIKTKRFWFFRKLYFH